MACRTLVAAATLAVLASLSPLPALAGPTHTLLIGGDDGYGTSACLADGGDCGKLVADALCAAQGYGASSNFHKAGADELTASIGPAPVTKDAFVISCGQ